MWRNRTISFGKVLYAAAWFFFVWGCSSLGPSRDIDIVGEIRSFNADLLNSSPAQAAAKFERMQKDVMSFNRGLNHVFYRFMQSVALPDRWLGTYSRQVTLHGDCHVENIGAYQGTGGNVVVDFIDFDDSFKGPILLDIYRCASSLYLAAKSDPMRERLVKAFIDAYAGTMRQIGQKEISVNIVLDENSSYALAGKLIRDAVLVDKAEFFSRFAKSKVENGKRLFAYSPDYEKAPQEMAEELMRSYLSGKDQAVPFVQQYYSIQDAVIERGSGVGSAGAFKVRIIVRGPTEEPLDDVVLEFKEEVAPSGALFAQKRYENQGERVLDGQKTMQTLPPEEIGTARRGDKYFFVAELQPVYRELHWRELVGSLQMKEAATIAGVLLAKGHARSSADSGAVAQEVTKILQAGQNRFYRDVYNFCAQYDNFLKKGYREFTEQLLSSPLLLLLIGGIAQRH